MILSQTAFSNHGRNSRIKRKAPSRDSDSKIPCRRRYSKASSSYRFLDAPSVHSQIVLDWLESSPSRWKIFVANLKNSKMTSEASWHHVKSQENPCRLCSKL
ncbi:hypothetical protein TNCV_3961191, partial [Trichonephila clavipes]